MTQQSGGGGVSSSQVVGGVLSGNIITPAFATNGTTPILGTVSAHLAADVPISSINTSFDGPSIALSPGTWWVGGHVTVINSSGAPANITAKLWDGTTVFDSGQQDAPAGFVAEVSLGWVVVVAVSATVKVSVLNTVSSGIIKAAASSNGQGNNASMIRALRIA